MSHIITSINFIMPELVIIIGAMMLLIISAFNQAKRKAVDLFECDNQMFSFSVISSVGLLLISAFVLFTRFDEVNIAFNGMLDNFIFSNFAKALILISGIIVMLMLLSQRNQSFATFEIPVLILISIAGQMFLISSNSLLSLYLSLEAMSLPLYILASSDRYRATSTEAGLKYFILGSIASGMLLFGISLVYGYSGQIQYDKLASYFSLSLMDGDSTYFPVGLLVGLIFITVAVCFKISAAPFHMWAPDVYQGAPTIITAFFASSAKVAAVFLFIRLILDPFAMLYEQWVPILLFISMSSMLIGSITAMMQHSFKRLLAYSSIGHIGFALTGFVSTELLGIQGLLLYIMLYLTMTFGVFAILLLLQKRNKETGVFDIEINDLRGLSKDSPILAFMLSILMLSMAGIPPFAGFFAKFYVLLPAIKQQLYLLSFVFVMSSVIACYYYLKIIKTMYFDSCNHAIIRNDTLCKADKLLALIAAISVMINIGFIFSPDVLLFIAEKVASIFIS